MVDDIIAYEGMFDSLITYHQSNSHPISEKENPLTAAHSFWDDGDDVFTKQQIDSFIDQLSTDTTWGEIYAMANKNLTVIEEAEANGTIIEDWKSTPKAERSMKKEHDSFTQRESNRNNDKGKGNFIN